MDEKISRWIRLEETSPSGNVLFQCTLCGRISKTADKICPKGCGEDEVSAEFLEAIRLEREEFKKGFKK